MPTELKSPFRDMNQNYTPDPSVGDVVDGRTIHGVRKVTGEYFVLLSPGDALQPWPLERKQ